MADVSHEPALEITVTVCYAVSGDSIQQKKIVLKRGATVRQALVKAGYEQLDGANHGLGVYGKRKTPDCLLHDGDRVEIYAPLSVDPKVARQRRVDKQRKDKPNRWSRR
jgi:putative ubiquitin-RnfH superfamily antitoxin RatB of RatAB toxin-antitoxin module